MVLKEQETLLETKPDSSIHISESDLDEWYETYRSYWWVVVTLLRFSDPRWNACINELAEQQLIKEIPVAVAVREP